MQVVQTAWFSRHPLSALELIKVSHRYHWYTDFYLWNKELKMSRVVFYFHLPSLQSASQKSCDDFLFLSKCSTEKLCLLADVMLVSMIILRIMVSKKNCFQHWNSKLITQYFCVHCVLNYTRLHDSS